MFPEFITNHINLLVSVEGEKKCVYKAQKVVCVILFSDHLCQSGIVDHILNIFLEFNEVNEISLIPLI